MVQLTVLHASMEGPMGLLHQLSLSDPTYAAKVQKIREDPESHPDLEVQETVILDRKGRVEVPDSADLKTQIIAQAHDSNLAGHFSTERTFENIDRYWTWTNKMKDVQDYVNSCVLCQRNKHPTAKAHGLLMPIIATRPWQIVCMDFVGSFTPAKKTRHTECLVLVDKFTKLVHLVPCHKEVDAAETAMMLIKHVVCLHGIPEVVISDRGPQFAAKLWTQILNKLGAKVSLAAAHHPQTDGQTERAIRTVLQMLRIYTHQRQASWEEYLPLFEFAINNTVADATKVTPFFANFGRHPTTPFQMISEQLHKRPDLPLTSRDDESSIFEKQQMKLSQTLENVWKNIGENLQQAAAEAKERYDKNRKELELNPGDLVLVSQSRIPMAAGNRKQRPLYGGPFVVEKQITPNTYRLEGVPNRLPAVWNVQFLKKFTPSPPKFAGRPDTAYAKPLDVEGEVEWEVAEIIKHKDTKRGKKYLVRWKDSPDQTWVPESNMTNCKRLLNSYHRKARQRGTQGSSAADEG